MKPADLDIAHTHRKLQGVFAAARDVTERKRFKQALQRRTSNWNGRTAALKKPTGSASSSPTCHTSCGPPLNGIA